MFGQSDYLSRDTKLTDDALCQRASFLNGNKTQPWAQAMARRRPGRLVWISLGSNISGSWGTPIETIKTALINISDRDVHVKAVSEIFMTAPVGGGRQPAFVNAVACLSCRMPTASLLRKFKAIERSAGRRQGRFWGPRPLDLDIIDAGIVLGRSTSGRRRVGHLILPHPLMHRRAFVLAPLAQLAPHWWHPVLQCSIGVLLRQPAVALQMRSLAPIPRASQPASGISAP
jgi:2-amino-4-hydroxy-6-hydroxymethyldihydropteridine diphosphokinase